MDELKVDLHIHTTASDGNLTPSEVVDMAHSIGLAGIAITDHDCVDGVDEALQAGRRLGIDIVPGVEISTRSAEGNDVHILGYFVDGDNDRLKELLFKASSERNVRARKIVDKLADCGVRLDYDEVLERSGGGVVGRPHIARELVSKGYCYSVASAFGKYLSKKGCAYVARASVGCEEAVRTVVQSGGVACVAHAGKIKNDGVIVGLIEHGLRAIEVYHPDHLSAARRFYTRFAKKHGLIIVGGSDAHCHPVGGTCVGDVTVGYGAVEELRETAG